jgi:hypothetical protein
MKSCMQVCLVNDLGNRTRLDAECRLSTTDLQYIRKKVRLVKELGNG